MNKLTILLIVVFLSSCSSNTEINNAINGLKEKSDISKQINTFNKVSSSSKDYLLYQQELGRINFILNNTQESIKNFKTAISIYNLQEEEGALGLGKTTKTALSATILDDNVLTYNGSDFERAMVHFYNALNYLKLNDLDSALVEIRASYDVQKYAISKREAQIDKTYSGLQKYSLPKDVASDLRKNQAIVANAKGKFLNAYLYYISGVIKESKGELNNALVDYKNALELYPNNIFIIENTLRLSAIYDRSYFTFLSKQHPNINFIKQSDYNNQTTITVIYEQGFIPQRISNKFNVFINGVVVGFALPSYKASPIKPYNIKITSSNKVATAQEIGNMYTLAQFDLSEHYPEILLRQLTRVASKSIIQAKALNKDEITPFGAATYLTTAILSVVEQADIRGFYTLPSVIQTATLNSIDNITDITLSVNDGKNITVGINNKTPEQILILVMDTGNFMYYNTLLRRKKFN